MKPLSGTHRITAEFTGKDGSAGYRHGRRYELVVVVGAASGKPRITYPLPCPYGSWDAFWKNWSQVS